MLRALSALSAVKTCDSCECCRCITNILSYLNVKCMLCCQHYATGKHELPISQGLSDNSRVFQNFMKSVLGIKAELCQTHTTTIASNNGTHRKYFEDD